MTYIGVSPSNGVRRVHTYTATGSQTTFTGASSEGITLSYTDANFMDVYQNGVLLAPADYTATSGTSVVLAEGAAASDIVTITVYDAFSVADTVSKSAGGTFDGNVAMAGTLGVTGVLTGTSLDISGNIDVDGTTNLDVVDIDGAVDMASTLNVTGAITGTLGTAAQTNITSVGTLTALTVDDITINGSTISDGGDLTVDVAGKIILSADDAGTFYFQDAATIYGVFEKSSTDWVIRAGEADGDIVFKGLDASSAVTALTLDMSAAGTAIFNSQIQAPSGAVSAPTFAFSNDTNTGMSRPTSDALNFVTAGAERVRINSSGNVIIGGTTGITTSGQTSLTIGNGTANPAITLYSATNNQGQISFGDATSGTGAYEGYIAYSHSSNIMNFGTNHAEAMRITSGGDLLVNTTTDTSGGFSIQTISSNTTSTRMLAHGFSVRNNWGSATNLGEGIFSSAGNTLCFSTASTERMRINSSGNVGIGLTSADRKLVVKDTGTATVGQFLQIDDNNSNATSNPLHINYSTLQLINAFSGAAPSANGTKVAKLAFATVTTSGYGATGSITCLATGTGYNSGALAFNTGSNNQNLETERMRINSSGYVYVNTGGAEPSASQVGVRITGTQGQNFWKSANSGTTGYNHMNFYNGNGHVGQIYTNASATVYGTSSDYRLKENVIYDFDATTRLKQLKPARFNFIADGTDSVVDGFLAHEVQSVVPEAITGTKDEVDDDGNAVMQGIDQSKLVPLLTKALQEQQATIEALTARITTLEGE